MDQDFKNRKIAITDIETTGLNSDTHEIIEIGLVLVNQPNLKVLDTWNVKVAPMHPVNADPIALKVNGYNKQEWNTAVPLKTAMRLYAKKTKDAIFCAHNITFDYAFLRRAFEETGVENLMDYHMIDIPSLVWLKLRNTALDGLNLNKTAYYLGLSVEPEPHRALNGALTALKVLKKLTEL